MREIIFRGKNATDNNWVYGFFTNQYVTSDTITMPPVELSTIVIESGEHIVIDYKSIGQYTGMKDKNGVRIFEGDIVKTKYGRLCKVFWFSSDCAQCWDLAPIEYKHPYPDKYDLWRSENLVIIGNIIDNLELLEVTK